jgi:hypothetical protein
LEFESELWPILLDTMCGRVSAKRPRRDPLNRCKQYLLASSAELANDCLEREAIVRMVTGFYWGLRCAWIGSLVTILILTFLGVRASQSSDAVILGSMGSQFGYIALFAVLYLFFNWVFMIQVEKRLHVLRLSECRAVFDSYLIVRSRQQPNVQLGV